MYACIEDASGECVNPAHSHRLCQIGRVGGVEGYGPVRRWYTNTAGTLYIDTTPRAWLAWECDDGPDPLPHWHRLCGPRRTTLLGATLRELENA